MRIILIFVNTAKNVPLTYEAHLLKSILSKKTIPSAFSIKILMKTYTNKIGIIMEITN